MAVRMHPECLAIFEKAGRWITGKTMHGKQASTVICLTLRNAAF